MPGVTRADSAASPSLVTTSLSPTHSHSLPASLFNAKADLPPSSTLSISQSATVSVIRMTGTQRVTAEPSTAISSTTGALSPRTDRKHRLENIMAGQQAKSATVGFRATAVTESQSQRQAKTEPMIAVNDHSASEPSVSEVSQHGTPIVPSTALPTPSPPLPSSSLPPRPAKGETPASGSSLSRQPTPAPSPMSRSSSGAGRLRSPNESPKRRTPTNVTTSHGYGPSSGVTTRSNSLTRKSSASHNLFAAINSSSQPRVPPSSSSTMSQVAVAADGDGLHHGDTPGKESIQKNTIRQYFLNPMQSTTVTQSIIHSHSHSNVTVQSSRPPPIRDDSDSQDDDVQDITEDEKTIKSKSRRSVSTTAAAEKRRTEKTKEREREKEHKAMLEAIERREIEVNDRERKIELDLENERRRIASLENQLKQLTHENQLLSQYQQSAKPAIIELLQRYIPLNRKKEKLDLWQSMDEVGEVISVNEGIGYQEAWVVGTRVREANNRLKQIEDERTKLVDESKKSRRKHTNKRARVDAHDSSGPNDGFARPPDIDLRAERAAKDLLDLQLAQLDSEKSELERVLREAECKRRMIVKTQKLRKEEMRSTYSPAAVLKDRYVILSLIGKGGFSEVFQAYDLQSNVYVALKVHSLNNNWHEDRRANYTKHASREYHIHQQLNHTNVVKLTDCYPLDNNAGFVTVLEYCDSQDLDAKLKKEGRLSERDARLIFLQVLHGLDYLHSEPRIIHYDLKPANILFHNRHTVKITDFGLSKILSSGQCDNDSSLLKETDLTSQGAGTYWYLPPECFDDPSVTLTSLSQSLHQSRAPASTPKISAAVDMFSAGIVLYQMLTGVKPFGHNQTAQEVMKSRLMRNAHSLNLKWPDDVKLCEPTMDLVKQLLSEQPRERPTARKALEHAFFTVNFDARPSARKRKHAGTVSASSNANGNGNGPSASHV